MPSTTTALEIYATQVRLSILVLRALEKSATLLIDEEKEKEHDKYLVANAMDIRRHARNLEDKLVDSTRYHLS